MWLIRRWFGQSISSLAKVIGPRIQQCGFNSTLIKFWGDDWPLLAESRPSFSWNSADLNVRYW